MKELDNASLALECAKNVSAENPVPSSNTFKISVANIRNQKKKACKKGRTMQNFQLQQEINQYSPHLDLSLIVAKVLEYLVSFSPLLSTEFCLFLL